VAPLPPQPSPTAAITLPESRGGCDPYYGAVGQCIWFPAGIADDPVAKCTVLAGRGLHAFPVNTINGVTDPHGLDVNANGTACDDEDY
jgi:hypothetical protein